MTLARVKAAFHPGGLADKRAELLDLIGRGDSTFFEGEVQWAIFLPEAEQRLRGHAESLDTAMADMAAALLMLADIHGDDARVMLSIGPETPPA